MTWTLGELRAELSRKWVVKIDERVPADVRAKWEAHMAAEEERFWSEHVRAWIREYPEVLERADTRDQVILRWAEMRFVMQYDVDLARWDHLGERAYVEWCNAEMDRQRAEFEIVFAEEMRRLEDDRREGAMIPNKLEAEQNPGKFALEPCPFCGSPAHLAFDESRFDGQWMECCYVECGRGCLDEDQHFNAPGAPQTPLVKTISEAVRIWNRRARA